VDRVAIKKAPHGGAFETQQQKSSMVDGVLHDVSYIERRHGKRIIRGARRPERIADYTENVVESERHQ
jgi:hypothetical protein